MKHRIAKFFFGGNKLKTSDAMLYGVESILFAAIVGVVCVLCTMLMNSVNIVRMYIVAYPATKKKKETRRRPF